jgi:ADP-ribose pyrophosphatase YjhB (NUDIX family)
MGTVHRIGKGGKKYRGEAGAGILFTDGKKILLLRRADGDEKETWGIPGGKANPNELAVDTAVRESKEECGNFAGRRVAKFEEPDNAFMWTTFMYKVNKPFRCKLSHEHDNWKWFPIDEVENQTLHSKFKSSWPCYLKSIKSKFNSRPTFREWVSSRL